MKNLSPGKIALLLVGGGLALFVLTAAILIMQFVSVRNELIAKEQRANAVYKDSQVVLDEFVAGFYDTFGVADRKSEQLNTILTNAVTGRYQGDSTSAKPFEGGERQALISAIVEAYPQIGTLDSYDRVITYIESGRAKFANQQRRMADVVRDYKTFIDTGVLRPFIVQSLLNAPTHRLEAAKGDHVLKGQDALDQMSVVIQSGKTKQAFESGEMEPLMTPNPDSGATTTDGTPVPQDPATGTMPPASQGGAQSGGDPAELAAK